MAIAALVAAGVVLVPPAQAGDAAAGKVLAEACADCHGEDGKGDEDFPAVAGMSEADFTQAMVEYRDGTRSDSKQMTKAAKKLTDEEIADLAAYYATLK
jgi:cytochrome c553